MAGDSERAPLLSDSGPPSPRPAPESTPLLADDQSPSDDHQHSQSEPRASADSTRPGLSARNSITTKTKTKSKKRRACSRWPSLVAILVLGLVSVIILIGVFCAPAAVEQYAKQAVVVEPTNLSLVSLTSDGVKARIQANFQLDSSRVDDENVRRMGKAATWVVGKLGTEETRVQVYLSDYGNVLLGTAAVPPVVVNLRDGQQTAIDFVADVTPGDSESFRSIANDWLDGKLNQVRVQGKADVHLKSGILSLGTHTIAESFVFEAHDLPQVPQYNITQLHFQEVDLPGQDRLAMGAEVSLSFFNEIPLSFDVPELGFEVLVPSCGSDPSILVANASTSVVSVRPRTDIDVEIHGVVRELPEKLMKACPGSQSSPLDLLLKQYMHGEEATFFVRGQPGGDSTPDWVGDLLSSVTVPVPFPGRTFDSLIRNFSLTDVHFSLPDPFADPDDPDANPKVSGTIEVTAALPSELNFDLNVTEVRATSDVLYGSKKLGELNVSEWQTANSTQSSADQKEGALLKVYSRIEDAPLRVTDSDVLADIMSRLLGGEDHVLLDIHAAVDVKVNTVLGDLALKDVPAEGKIPVKPLPGKTIGDLQPQVGDFRVLETSTKGVRLGAFVNVTNPTGYTARVPSANLHVACNGTVIGEVMARKLDVGKGLNTNLWVEAEWSPGRRGVVSRQVGRELLSQYLSGFNVTLELKAHRSSIPGQPALGEALSHLNLTMPAPRLRKPGSDQDLTFIQDAVFHIFSSTASFTLVSPFQHNIIYVDKVNATALYNHTEPLGSIDYDLPFAAGPGASQTPKLPVDWSLGSVGYQKLLDALGGQLKLDARAVVDIRIGRWRETLWYMGRGIGARVRL